MPAGKISEALDKFRMTAEDKDRFYEFLESLPEHDRVVFAFEGLKSTLMQQLGGGSNHLIGLFYADRLVLTTRGMVKVSKEKAHAEYPLDEISDVSVRSGPIFSSVTLRFKSGPKVKIGNVNTHLAQHLDRFMSEGLKAFDPAGLDLKTFNAMFYSYVLTGMPLPDFLKHHKDSVA